MASSDNGTMVSNVMKILKTSTTNKKLKSELLRNSCYRQLKKLTEQFKTHPKQVLSLIEALDLVNEHYSSNVKDKINEEMIWWYKSALAYPTHTGTYSMINSMF